MISSVRRRTLGGIISALNGDAPIALVRETANFDRRRGGEVARKYLWAGCSQTVGTHHAPRVLDAACWWWLDTKPQSQKQ